MQDSENKSSADRREFFRLNDSVAIDFRQLQSDELETVRARIHSDQPDRFSVAAKFATSSRTMDMQLRTISKSSPTIAAFLKEVDKKMNILAGLMAVEELTGIDCPSRPVNLSAGGVAFFSANPFNRDDMLEVRLVLFPTQIGIRFIGRVVSSTTDLKDEGEQPYYISVEMDTIRDSDRDLLVKHLLHKQTVELHEQRFPDEV
ncbi:hypothetical protein BOW53_00860 [Solemya pervernicosa gill symbiont]|uniref:PilZ domain-containing protein n=2 Tax=Gammaproteobacteria incertae sedis TaxID=118884 RepID=A0A1T2LAP1_9GAMM|nr:PilZ domain-containing protein [Candidatus Reidiella endopervernicosa]OOZ42161.1 hypothetical protein BOW53_00860 [Solemya pervernicosa gill symbiont]QKQ27272.1 PilZ domain-containing protein [Candidatus Reidiella endopervernicosa]